MKPGDSWCGSPGFLVRGGTAGPSKTLRAATGVADLLHAEEPRFSGQIGLVWSGVGTRVWRRSGDVGPGRLSIRAGAGNDSGPSLRAQKPETVALLRYRSSGVSASAGIMPDMRGRSLTAGACILLSGLGLGACSRHPTPTPATPTPVLPSACAKNVSVAAAVLFDAVGGSGSVAVSAPAGCRWSSSPSEYLPIVDPAGR